MKDIGHALSNGARALAVTWYDSRPNEGVGLFVWTESPDPFVTWSIARKDGQWNCFTGHYYTSLAAAIEDYQTRGGKIS
jgi:hypothetical protein